MNAVAIPEKEKQSRMYRLFFEYPVSLNYAGIMANSCLSWG
jgi:hypothetical protein